MKSSETYNPNFEAIDFMIDLMEKWTDELKKGKRMIWIDKGLLKWVDKKVNDSTYASRSHAIESVLAEKMNLRKK